MASQGAKRRAELRTDRIVGERDPFVWFLQGNVNAHRPCHRLQVPSRLGSDLPEGQGYIHGGFLAAFKSTWPQVEAFLTCGHSLGGAQATLASLQLALLVNAPSTQPRQVTFGSPRSLSRAADYFGRVMGSCTLRVAENDVDVVTMVAPGFLGFKHVGVNLAVAKPVGVLPHLMEGYTHGVSSLTAITFTPTYARGARRAFFLAVRRCLGLF